MRLLCVRACVRACVEIWITRSPAGHPLFMVWIRLCNRHTFAAGDSSNEAGGVTTPMPAVHGDTSRCILMHNNIARYVFDLGE